MAKVRTKKVTEEKAESPKKQGRAATKKKTVEASTSKEKSTMKEKPTTSKDKPEKRSRSKSNTSRKVTSTISDADVDSGISSPEKPRKRQSKNHSIASSSISKISKKSKSTISKAVNKKTSEITWLTGLLQDEIKSNRKRKRTAAGIEIRYPSSLSYRVEEKIEYVTYPWNNGKCGGYVKVAPGLEKIPKRTSSTMTFLILMGKICLLSGSSSTEYKAGSVITIEKGVKYGFKNKRKEPCFLRFQSICDDA